jgi:hypothetical protein
MSAVGGVVDAVEVGGDVLDEFVDVGGVGFFADELTDEDLPGTVGMLALVDGPKRTTRASLPLLVSAPLLVDLPPVRPLASDGDAVTLTCVWARASSRPAPEQPPLALRKAAPCAGQAPSGAQRVKRATLLKSRKHRTQASASLSDLSSE